MSFDTSRKLWGWGRAEAAVSEPLLAMASALLGQRFGAALAEPCPVPTLETLALPPPRLEPPAALAEWLTAAPYHRAAHTYGKAFRDVVRALGGDYSPAPDLVAYPRHEAHVERLLAWAAAEGVAVVPYGGGSSVVGGVELRAEQRARYAGVVTLDLSELSSVLEVDHASQSARVQAGVYGPALQAQLAPHGYCLRHYPQSFEFSTVGGWIATRAGGHYATGPTHIDDFVQALRVVTPRGVLATRRLPGNGAGPQEERLWLGSEGALGVITEAWLRVQRSPRYRASCSVGFQRFEDGAEACRQLAQSALLPANARLIQREEALFMGAGDGERHLLLLGFESAVTPQGHQLAAALELCRAAGGAPGRPRERVAEQGAGGDDAEQWKASFLRAPYLRDELVRRGLVLETFETCTTWQNFPALDAALRAALTRAFEQTTGQGLVTCRFTHLYPDGPAPYYTVIAPSRFGQQLAHWDALKHAASQAIVEHGATITHHHAVGRDHRPYYEQQSAPLALELLRGAKRALDPQGIMNPGVLLAPEPLSPGRASPR